MWHWASATGTGKSAAGTEKVQLALGKCTGTGKVQLALGKCNSHCTGKVLALEKCNWHWKSGTGTGKVQLALGKCTGTGKSAAGAGQVQLPLRWKSAGTGKVQLALEKVQLALGKCNSHCTGKVLALEKCNWHWKSGTGTEKVQLALGKCHWRWHWISAVQLWPRSQALDLFTTPSVHCWPCLEQMVALVSWSKLKV